MGSQEIKVVHFPTVGLSSLQGWGQNPSIAGWNEGSEFKSVSQTLQKVLESGSSPVPSETMEETGLEMWRDS